MDQDAYNHRNTHIYVRVSTNDNSLIETVFDVNIFKPNTYDRNKRLRDATCDIDEKSHINTLTLSNKDWIQFLKIMKAPVRINPNLKQASQYYNDAKDI